MPVSQRAKWEIKRASQLKFPAPQTMRQAMKQDGVHARIGGQHLPTGTGGGVALEHDRNIFTQMFKHERPKGYN